MILKKYDEWMQFSKINYTTTTWILLSVFSTIISVFFGLTINFLIIGEFTLIPLAFGSATLVLILGYPYLIKESIIDSIEYNFSDALKQMAETLKAGDTYESALREVVNSDYGRLSDEMEIALRRLEEGQNIQNALNGFANRIDSRLVKRTIIILLDSIKTGASLSTILEDIADDVKDLYRLKEDRKANTTMQFIFMIAAGGVIAPLIFGEITAILNLFANISINTLAQGSTINNSATIFILLLIQAYLIIEVIASGIMMAIIREGKINKSIIYIPILLLVAYITYYLSSFVISIMLSGAF